MNKGFHKAAWSLAGLVLIATATAFASKEVGAAELVVFGSEDCAISQRYHREAVAGYSATRGRKVFPLRHVDIRDGNAGVLLKRAVTQTPTFVFVDEGREIARVTGYPGRELLYSIVDEAAKILFGEKSTY